MCDLGLTTLVFCPCSLFIYIICYNYFFLCYSPFNVEFKDQLPSTEEVQQLLSPQTPFYYFLPMSFFSSFSAPFLLYLLHSSLPFMTSSVTEYELSGFKNSPIFPGTSNKFWLYLHSVQVGAFIIAHGLIII